VRKERRVRADEGRRGERRWGEGEEEEGEKGRKEWQWHEKRGEEGEEEVIPYIFEIFRCFLNFSVMHQGVVLAESRKGIGAQRHSISPNKFRS